ncbi:SAM-dependent methyltransferase [Streptomyces sp. RY43-2]|uniref:SAM-dependent methyltransferase n=1 Tax=Streptomyces macrolidinus TaxID=2952607 RepID=A0ABT0ZAL5_9ACTN|nr:SAM-dependent methyltransferase [Streptomyces macrolidinus]MCN9240540.1 SAM-dependent methyltransferase [Streptomyces macrolidinus]
MYERPTGPMVPINSSVAHPARVYNAWLGGKDNYLADREAAELAAAANPEIVPAVRANRAFLGRAVRHLAGEAGIRQFLDIGTGIPAADNTHEVAQRVDPGARVVYVDNDPIVLAHARALLVSAAEGRTDYLQADLRDVDRILAAAGKTLDLSQPVGLMLVAVLQYVPDADDPYDLTRRLLDALAPGSHLVLSHPAADIGAEKVVESMRAYNERAAEHAGATPRTHAGVTRFFDSTDLLAPGVVQLPEWRPEGEGVAAPGPLPMWCGVGRK